LRIWLPAFCSDVDVAAFSSGAAVEALELNSQPAEPTSQPAQVQRRKCPDSPSRDWPLSGLFRFQKRSTRKRVDDGSA